MTHTLCSRFRRGIAGTAIGGLALLYVVAVPAHTAEPLDVPIPISVLSAEDLEKLPSVTRNLADLALLQPGQTVAVPGRYSSINLRGLGSSPGTIVDGVPVRPGPDAIPLDQIEKIEIPLGIGTMRDGTDITRFIIPKEVTPGPVMLHFVSDSGEQMQPVHIFAFVRSWLEREKLASFQRAQFGFDLDFGRGPGKITVVVATSGAITYAKNGKPQVLSINDNGKAELIDYIQALKGTPEGLPFNIVPSFSKLTLRKK